MKKLVDLFNSLMDTNKRLKITIFTTSLLTFIASSGLVEKESLDTVILCISGICGSYLGLQTTSDVKGKGDKTTENGDK